MRVVVLGAAITFAACGGTQYPAPADPEAAVRQFLQAVQSNSLTGMGSVWGTSRGPALHRMDRRELEQRLTVMRVVLVHERFEFVTGNLPAIQTPGESVLHVRLHRNGCSPVVPFTVVRYGAGWLVEQMDLEAAGNPRRSCRS